MSSNFSFEANKEEVGRFFLCGGEKGGGCGGNGGAGRRGSGGDMGEGGTQVGKSVDEKTVGEEGWKGKIDNFVFNKY